MCKSTFVHTVKEYSSFQCADYCPKRMAKRHYYAINAGMNRIAGHEEKVLTRACMYIIIFTWVGVGGRHGQDPTTRAGQAGSAARARNVESAPEESHRLPFPGKRLLRSPR